ncbi:MAG TPA: hypothetical protein VM240_14095 [Verrucomicrobiae bacterium]|nr:hypothetical protein [Verrucomicrobiae bacterium]
MTPRILAIALMILLASCASRREPEFGNSVRTMIREQTYDPSAPTGPLVGGLDGQKAALALDAYHAEKKPPAKSTGTALLVPTPQ